jgi:predicted ATPase/class 3 adenylate cyclase
MLFTDIEGSTTMVRTLGTDRWEAVLEIHSSIIRKALATHGGTEVRTEGDAFFVVFTSPTAAVRAAVSAQRGLSAATWPHGITISVRIGLHTGEARPASSAAGTDYVGLEVHRAARIAAAGHGGQVLVSETTIALVRDALTQGLAFRDLGEHRFKDLVRPERIYQLLIDGLPDSFPPLRSLDTTPNNLPTQATSFVGRERELASALARFASNRLLTLTGSGGTGKTRLALHIAADTLDRYADGAWLVELAPIRDPAAVGSAVALALHVPERPGEKMIEAISASLTDRELLLVLDNCEHLIAVCAQLADALLRSCPRIKILATSREGLGVPGEALMPVPSLRVPDADPLPPPDELREYEAVRLFVERSAAYQPAFMLTTENAADIVRICRRLDGIPLALELAAARVRSLSVAQLAQRLDDRFRLLTGGGRTVVARQQTLRALIDWSYDLLSDIERLLLRRLSVFVNGWTLEAAEAVCAGDGLARDAVLDGLAHLVDKSLATMRERGGMARYTMLETVREYAREKLVDSGEAQALRQRHFDHFLERVVDASNAPSDSAAHPRLALDYENLHAALEWIQAEPNSSERELLFAGSMFTAAMVLGRGAELYRILTAALARSDPAARTLGRTRAISSAAGLAAQRGDYRAAAALGEEAIGLLRTLGSKRELAFALVSKARALRNDPVASSLAANEGRDLFQEIGDTWGLAMANFILADGALEHGDYAAARVGITESLALFRKLGDVSRSSSPLLSLGRLACIEGDYSGARALVEQALAIRRERTPDNPIMIAIALNSLGEVGRCEGNPTGAAPLFEEALRLAREPGDEMIASWSLHNLGHIALHSGELWTAAARFRESLIYRALEGPSVNVAAGLAGLAGIALRRGAFAEAGRLFGAVEAMLDSVRGVLAPADQAVRKADLTTARARVGEDSVAAALEAGRTATPDEVAKLTNAVTIGLATQRDPVFT